MNVQATRGVPLAVSLLALLVGLVGGLFQPGATKTAEGHWWTWPTFPYLRDTSNMWGYRDMEFAWTNWSGGWSWSSGVYTYLHIVSAGNYHDNWGTVVSDDGTVPTSFWQGYRLVDSSTGLTWWPSSSGNRDNHNEIHVGTATCKANALCASVSWVGGGAYLGARVLNNQSSATCMIKQHPFGSGC